jgi:hypothetical protein
VAIAVVVNVSVAVQTVPVAGATVYESVALITAVAFT